MNSETVSAIVLDYRAAEKTRDCLKSLAGQGLQTTYVLDNSDSESASLELRQALRQLQSSGIDFKIEILSAGKNLGFGRGVNFVLSHDRHAGSPHEYYLLLNNDAVAGPSLVRGLINVIKQDSQIALVAPRIVSNDPGREFGIWYQRYLGLLLSRPGRFRFHYLVGCCLLFRKDLLGEDRLFDEAFFMYGEDAELGWRLTRQGKSISCAKDVFIQHEFGPSVDRASFFYEYHMVRSHLLLSLRTWIHPAEIPFLVTTKSLSLGCRALIRSFRHRSLVPLAAYLLAWLPLNPNGPGS
ncbi:MAG: glycosyltransferase [Deltaproteobacteria bacterium]|nr:glycosyltransferase [Deltaproteobacteria bacterium]